MEFSLNKISGSAPHSAFTDLCEWRGHLYCCFREARTHVSQDGRIRILKLDLGGNILMSRYLHEYNSDLRDPKLTVHSNGKLCLLLWKKQFNAKKEFVGANSYICFSDNGQSWSRLKNIGHGGWWLWRIRWHRKYHATADRWTSTSYGFAYNRSANAVNFYGGDPLGTFHLKQEHALSLEKHKKGYPNESDIVFDGDHAWAIVRRDADSYSAQLGYAKWPFNNWRWHDLGVYLGGPCVLKKDENTLFVAARVWESNKLATRLLELDLLSKQLRTIRELPSAGDNSYPGMAKVGDNLFVSYYSEHENNKSQIHLATFRDA